MNSIDTSFNVPTATKALEIAEDVFKIKNDHRLQAITRNLKYISEAVTKAINSETPRNGSYSIFLYEKDMKNYCDDSIKEFTKLMTARDYSLVITPERRIFSKYRRFLIVFTPKVPASPATSTIQQPKSRRSVNGNWSASSTSGASRASPVSTPSSGLRPHT